MPTLTFILETVLAFCSNAWIVKNYQFEEVLKHFSSIWAHYDCFKTENKERKKKQKLIVWEWESMNLNAVGECLFFIQVWFNL